MIDEASPELDDIDPFDLTFSSFHKHMLTTVLHVF